MRTAAKRGTRNLSNAERGMRSAESLDARRLEAGRRSWGRLCRTIRRGKARF